MILMQAISITMAIGKGGPWNGNEQSECHLGPKTTYVTLIITALYVMQIHYLGKWEGVGHWVLKFFGPQMALA